MLMNPGRRGFIGPIGDDLPTMLVIILGLGLFFSGVVFAMDLYNQKNRSIAISEGALAISRVFTAGGYFDQDNLNEMGQKADLIARSYSLSYQVKTDGGCSYPSSSDICDDNSAYKYSFLIASLEQDKNLDLLEVCVKG